MKKILLVMVIFLGIFLTSAATWQSGGGSASNNVNLNSPSNLYVWKNNGTIYLNFTANVVGANIDNATLWTNHTGTWKINQTISYKSTSNSNSNNISFGLQTGADNPKYGNAFQPVVTTTIKNITIKSSDTNPTKCYLFASEDVTTSILANGTFDGLSCSFNMSYPVTALTTYSVAVDKAGSNHQAYYNDTISWNRTLGDIKFIHSGWNSNSGYKNNFNYGIETIGTSTSTTSNVSYAFQLNQTFAEALAHPSWAWNVQVYDSDVGEGWAISNKTLIVHIPYVINSTSYNTTTYETAKENFIMTLTTNGTFNPTSILSYNGTNYTATRTGSNHYVFTKTIYPSSVGLKNVFWQIKDGETLVESPVTQQVSSINFAICNSTYNLAYLNFTFKNETTSLQVVNSSIISSWTYWLSDRAYNKTYTYTNSSYLASYSFCFTPADKVVYTDGRIQYQNTESPQRTYELSSTLSNSSTSQILYLLPNSLGKYVYFKVVTTADAVVSGATAQVSKTINLVSTIINIGTTDDSGLVSFWLNPDDIYDFVFSKSGYGSSSFSLVPNSNEVYQVTLGSGGITSISNGTTIGNNLSYSIEPSNSSLKNNTDYTFGFNVNGTGITYISMTIKNSTGSQLGTTNYAGQGSITLSLNTGNNTQLIGYFNIQTATENMSVTKVWIIGEEFVGSYSLFQQLKLFGDYGFKPIWKILIAIIIITGLTIFLSKEELIDTSESKIMVVLLLVWIFSIVGWFDTGLLGDGSKLASFGSQYGIAIISSIGGAGLILIGRLVNKL